jgi:hypothetical protein
MLLTKEFIDSVKYYEIKKYYGASCIRTYFHFHFKAWWKPNMSISMDWDVVDTTENGDLNCETSRITEFTKSLRTAFGY